MRIAVVEPIGQGGMIHYSYTLCRALQNRGAEVTLFTSSHYELGDLPHDFALDTGLRLWDARPARSLPLPVQLVRRAARGLRYVWEMARLARRLRHTEPEAVLMGEIRFRVDRVFVQRMTRTGAVLGDIIHDVQPFDTRRHSSDVLRDDSGSLHDAYALFDVLFVHGERNRSTLLDVTDLDGENVVSIPLAVDATKRIIPETSSADELRSEFGIVDGQPVLLFFGTLSKYKGLEDLLDAFAAVRDATGAKLVIAGYAAKDIDPQELGRRAEERGISEDIVWSLGYVPNGIVAPLMRLADVVVLPYRAISDSAVLKVAMSFGRPIVATRVGGLPDTIDQGRTGVLVEPENPDALAEALISLISDPDRRRLMGAAAAEAAESDFGEVAVASSVLAALRRARS